MMRKRMDLSENRLWLIVCTVAILCGFISFFVTVQIYDANQKNDFQMLTDVKKPESIIVKNEERPNIVEQRQEIINNDLEQKVKRDRKVENSETPVVTMVEKVSDDAQRPREDSKTFEMNSDVFDSKEPVDEVFEVMSTTVVADEASKRIISFQRPLEGELGMEYSKERLIYSKTLNEWITHPAVDIMAEEAEPVKVIADGVVSEIKMDPRYGNTIIVNHENGYQSLYANLSTIDLVYVGKTVKKGEIIAGVGKGFGFEAEEKPHLHLEVWKEEEYINPYDLFE